MSKQPAESPEMIEAGELDVAIDRDGELPIGVQLAWALRTRIGDGRFKPGQRLPGLRDLARATGVNVNTARAVYQRLEQEGLIESQQGSGTFVASCSREASDVGVIAAGAARRARLAGVDPRAVAAALYVSSQPLSDTEQLAAARRGTLRTQITVLERALGELEATHPGLVPPSSTTRRHVGPRLLSAEELEQVRAGLVRRLAGIQAAIDAALSTEETATHDPPRAPAKSAARKRAARPRSGTRPAPAGA
ncbi:MAG: GntR family transcriptional regulator [Solirubrobacteraceae bacterium]